MDAEMQRKLRGKFEWEHIGKKPKLTCKACREARWKACPEHPAVWCDDCKQQISPKHMHIEFLGHANVTDRLLEVDPDWDWEPVAFAADGLPKFDANGGLWIRLTIGGVTRLGYGGSDGKQGEDAVKEAIGDAIKVAAMRFGVGLDLWRKEEPSGVGDAPTPQIQPQHQRRSQRPRAVQDDPATAPDPVTRARADLAKLAAEKGLDLTQVANRYKAVTGADLGSETDAGKIAEFAATLTAPTAEAS